MNALVVIVALALVSGCASLFEPDHCGPVDPPTKEVYVLDAGEEAGSCESLCPFIEGKHSCRFITTTTDAGSPARAVECTQTVICD
ncbi:MAG: hypothetical protein ACXVEE_26105 [Polyangiales bacterium]